MLPLSPPPGYFKEINSIISKFIWNDKCPRIKLTTLQHPNSTGGLAVPNFELYYWSFQIKALHNWVDPQSTVSWRVIEADKVKPNRLQDILFTGTGKKGDNYKFGPVVANSIKIWKTVERRIGGPFKFCNSTPLWHNFNFVCGNRPFVQPSWSSLGVNTCGDIYDNQGLCSFQALRAKFCLPASAYFVFLQLRSALKAYGVPWSSSISSHPMRDWIAPSAGRPSVSLIYNKIIDCITKPLSIKTIWNRELSDLNLSVDWERVWSNLSLTSKNLAHRLIHFKVIHRAYITPYKRFKMKLQSNLDCHICNTTSSGTFLHMFWECPVVISLWTHVNLVLSSLLRIDWSVNPSLCLLNDDSVLCISSMQKRMLFAGFTAVKKTIIQNWFTPHMCREAYWIRSLLQIVSCECTTARVGGARPSTIEAWQCFLLNIRDYVKEWFLCSCCPSLSPSLLIEPWDVEYVSAVLFCFILDIMLCCVWKNKIKIVDNKKRKSGWRQNPTSDWRQSPTLDRRCILVENENRVDVRTQRQIDVNVQRWTDVVSGWKWKSGWRQNPTSDWRQSPTLDRRCILVENENRVDVRTQRQIDVNLQRWTDVVFWLKMKIRLTSEPNVRLTSEPIVNLTSISSVGQTLHFGWKWKSGWLQNPKLNWFQSPTLYRHCITSLLKMAITTFVINLWIQKEEELNVQIINYT